MCGIGAILRLDMTPAEALEPRLAVMNRFVQHRGPDAGSSEITALERGGQPMHDEAGNWITYNGEIYNYLELRKEIGEGEFRTTSDTEVVLRAYRKWGPACVERFRGMFAFALWDE